jgi:hypothetical protein
LVETASFPDLAACGALGFVEPKPGARRRARSNLTGQTTRLFTEICDAKQTLDQGRTSAGAFELLTQQKGRRRQRCINHAGVWLKRPELFPDRLSGQLPRRLLRCEKSLASRGAGRASFTQGELNASRATVSVGVAFCNEATADLAGLLKAADQALYRAKRPVATAWKRRPLQPKAFRSDSRTTYQLINDLPRRLWCRLEPQARNTSVCA